jgi:hypothetical protein
VPACPHSGLQVGGRCYWCLKRAALNGSRSKLSDEALIFLGFGVHLGAQASSQGRTWLQPTKPSNIDKQLEELERLRDIAPGWFALARELVKDDE